MVGALYLGGVMTVNHVNNACSLNTVNKDSQQPERLCRHFDHLELQPVHQNLVQTSKINH